MFPPARGRRLARGAARRRRAAGAAHMHEHATTAPSVARSPRAPASTEAHRRRHLREHDGDQDQRVSDGWRLVRANVFSRHSGPDLLLNVTDCFVLLVLFGLGLFLLLGLARSRFRLRRTSTLSVREEGEGSCDRTSLRFARGVGIFSSVGARLCSATIRAACSTSSNDPSDSCPPSFLQ